MARRKRNYKRNLEADSKYNNVLITQFINYLMLDGKKSVAENIVYNAMDILHTETQKDPVGVFSQAIKNISPLVEVRSKRVGGANYQVPIEVRPDRRVALAFRWLLTSARKRKGMDMEKRLSAELMDAYNKTGSVIKKKDDTHRMAEANRAFAHLG